MEKLPCWPEEGTKLILWTPGHSAGRHSYGHHTSERIQRKLTLVKEVLVDTE
jgi:hypothetical protein